MIVIRSVVLLYDSQEAITSARARQGEGLRVVVMQHAGQAEVAAETSICKQFGNISPTHQRYMIVASYIVRRYTSSRK